MDEKTIKELLDLGLSDKEARVYLANLSLGYSTVQKIAQRAGIKRVTTYVILDSLMQKGLISQITKAKKTLFAAEEPENLVRLLERAERDINDKRSHLRSIMPKLREIHELPAERPEVRFYTGIEGMKTIVGTVLKDSREHKGVIYGIVNQEKIDRLIKAEELAEHSTKRVRLGVKSRMLYAGAEPPPKPLREQKFVPDKYPIDADITLVKDKMFIVSYEAEKPVGLIIEEPHITKTFRSLFEMAWDRSDLLHEDPKSKSK